jgi:hypothetical protein
MSGLADETLKPMQRGCNNMKDRQGYHPNYLATLRVALRRYDSRRVEVSQGYCGEGRMTFLITRPTPVISEWLVN